jgi:hypothetical protein
LLAVLLGLSLLAKTVLAGGPVALTWNQATDCPSVVGWELLVAPISTANPNPPVTTASVGVSFANNVPPCGLSMSRTVNVSGVGQQRFWLRAVATASKSSESNSIDASLPLGKPDGLTVVPQ